MEDISTKLRWRNSRLVKVLNYAFKIWVFEGLTIRLKINQEIKDYFDELETFGGIGPEKKELERLR